MTRQRSHPQNATETPAAVGAATPRRRVTLRTLAEATNLGVTTVARALRDDEKIAKLTRERVRAAALALGYRPDRAARGLRMGRTMTLGLILDQSLAAAEFERRIISGAAKVIYGESSYNLMVFPQTAGTDPIKPVRFLVEDAQVDGLVFAHITPSDARVEYLLDSNVPFVTHGRTANPERHSYFDFDNEQFAAMAMNHLASLGRRSIAYVPGTPGLTAAQAMARGVGQAADRLKINAFPLGGVLLSDAPARYYEAARTLRRGNSLPDGVICANETATIALLAGLEDAGLILGRDIDVVARSTSDVLDYVRPTVDSLHEDLFAAGEGLARLLLRQLAGESIAELQELQQPRFVRRRT